MQRRKANRVFCDRVIGRLNKFLGRAFPITDDPIAKSPNSCGLLEDRDLPGMIQLVLRNSVKHEAEIIFLARDAIA
jgi:hypothetical protein